MFNNPNNPLGKSFNDDELKFIAELASTHDLLIISDQAHEFTLDTMTSIGMSTDEINLLPDINPLQSLRYFRLNTVNVIFSATLPAMFQRTITIGTASKAFGVPSWRIGWAFGPKDIIQRITYVQAQIIRSPSTPPQVKYDSLSRVWISTLFLFK